MIILREDMEVLEGHHRLSAALNICPDIRQFEIKVIVIKQDQSRILKILYFDLALNRLALKEPDNGKKEKDS